MKKLCVLLAALLLCALLAPAASAVTGLSPAVTLYVPWDEIPPGAVYLELLVSDGGFRDRSSVSLKANYGMEETAGIYTYDEDGYRSLSFSTQTVGCSPLLEYYVCFTATQAEYSRYRVLFDRLGDALERQNDPEAPYLCDAYFVYGTPEATAAHSLAALLDEEWFPGGACESYFWYGGELTNPITPSYVKAAFVNEAGKILSVSTRCKLPTGTDEAELIFSYGKLQVFDDYDGVSPRVKTIATTISLVLSVALTLGLLLLLSSRRKKRTVRGCEGWLPRFVFDADPAAAKAQRKEALRRRGAKERLGVFVRVLMSAVTLGTVFAFYAFYHRLPVVPRWGFVISTLIILFAHVFLHEFGHVLFGRLTGYRLLWMRIGRLALIPVSGKPRLRIDPIRVLPWMGGATSMAPPEGAADDVRVVPLLIGGVTVNAVTSLLCLTAGFLLKADFWRLVFFYAAALGLILALENALPLPLRVLRTDGVQLRDVLASPEAKDAHLRTGRISAQLNAGMRYSGIDPALFSSPASLDLKNGAQSSLALLGWMRALDEADLRSAKAIGALLTADDSALSPAWKAQLKLFDLYCDLLEGTYAGRPEVYLSDTQKQVLQRFPYDPLLAAVKHAFDLLYVRDLNAAAETKRLVETKPFSSLSPEHRDVALSLIWANERRARDWGLIL